MLAAAVLLAGCDDTQEGRETASRVAAAIKRVCSPSPELRGEASGPRTITPIDLDGSSGPSGFLVTCINGRVEYVRAPK